METELTIGRLAKTSGVSVQTVRYYERRRLVLPSSRSASGYRRYGPESARRLRFIRNAKSLGFSLDEIGSLLRLRGGGASCERTRRRAAARARDVRERIEGLLAIERALKRLIAACARRGPSEACPILRSLEAE
jgi:DNA-binding transcriptional MerR regulator